jgi:hypothetical protein
MQAAWFGLGFKLLETGTHAAGVIARRSAMLAAAALEPARLADPEFVRMVAEKAEATGEACLRAARHAGRAGQRDGAGRLGHRPGRGLPRALPSPRARQCPPPRPQTLTGSRSAPGASTRSQGALR